MINTVALSQSEKEYEYERPLYNINGQLNGIQRYNNEYHRYEHLYKDGVIQEAINYRVIIEGKSPIKGIYKDGIPYSGYFVHSENEMELYLTDYYENGEMKAQYSRPLMALNEEGEVYVTDAESDYERKTISVPLKTTFVDGKVNDGVLYHFYKLKDSAFLLATEHYKQGQNQYVDLLIGAIHYADFLRLEFTKKGYIIKYKGNMETKGGSINVSYENMHGRVTLSSKSSFEFVNAPITQDLLPKSGSVYYYKHEGMFYYQQNTKIALTRKFYASNSSILNGVFEGLMKKVWMYSYVSENNYSELFDGFLSNRSNGKFHSRLFLIKNGKPHLGTLINYEKDTDTYTYIKYKNGAVVKSQKYMTAEQLEDLAIFDSKDFIMEK